MPPAARIGDAHACPAVTGKIPHVGGPVLAGEPTVIIGYQPAARAGDGVKCVPARGSIAAGEGSVLIGDLPAARMGDATAHGGRIVAGCPTVLIGSSPQAEALRTNKPFCEECERKRREREERRKRGRQA